MRIANPVYDVVFKYLLDDEKVAKLLLSALLGREVLELTYRATEVRSEVHTSVLVLRLDSAATVRLEDGSSKLVLIEIQKAQNPLDVMRFRRYLGAQYGNPDNVYAGPGGQRRVLPIVTIYLLGAGLDQTDAPVVRVNRQYTDAATGEAIRITEPFVEALTHDSIVVQIDKLRGRRRTDLERLLVVFDQGFACGDPHYLEFPDQDYPDRYQEVLRRLIRAIAEQALKDGMDVEDELLGLLLDKDRLVAEQAKVLEGQAKDLKEQAKALDELARTLDEQARTLAEKDRIIDELKKKAR